MPCGRLFFSLPEALDGLEAFLEYSMDLYNSSLRNPMGLGEVFY